MDEIKTHKKKIEIAEESQEEEIIEGQALEKEELEPRQHHRPSHKTPGHEKPEAKDHKPNLGKKMQYAAFAAVSTTERLINGLSGIYESIFVGKDDRRLDFDKEQGLKCFDGKDYKNAISYFNSFLESGHDSDPEILFLLGLSHVNLEEYEKAVDYFKKARKLDSADQDITVELAHCLLSMEDYVDAANCFKQAIEMAPNEADHYYHLGSCLEKTDQIEEAKKMYRKAIDLSPREAMYYQALGFVYENSGNHKDAIVCFKKAMDLDRKQRMAGGGIKKRQLSNSAPRAQKRCAGAVSVHEE